MQKDQITRGHWVLFVFALLAVGSLGRQYISSAQRSNPAPYRTGQGGRNPQQMGARALERMTQQLNLTPQQQTQIKVILDGSRPQMEQVRRNAALNTEQRREQMRLLRTQTQNSINQLLSPAQQTKYATMQAEMRGRFGGGDRRGGDRPGGAR